MSRREQSERSVFLPGWPGSNRELLGSLQSRYSRNNGPTGGRSLSSLLSLRGMNNGSVERVEAAKEETGGKLKTSSKIELIAASQLAQLAEDAAQCQRCPFYRSATQVVFSGGPTNASLMIVGEQPGDHEDREGRPFVGPAGRVFDQALAEAGLDRRSAYLTNAVKYFKHEQRGKRRLHKHPNRDEVQKCCWWLDQELALVKPKLVVALGAVAASALIRRTMVLARERGRLLRWADGSRGLATIHPSAVLRMPDESSRHREASGLASDLRQALLLAESTNDGP
jgi:uracil-DNA glycosylase family protein